MTVTFQYHQLFRFPGVGVKLLRLLGQNQTVVIAGNEQYWPGRNLAYNPLWVETNGVVHVLNGNSADGGGVVSPGGLGEFSGLAVWQQNFAALHQMGLAGGGSMLRGLDKRISLKTKLPVHVADDPLRAVAMGTGIALKNADRFQFLIR